MLSNEQRFARWLVASAPFRAADPLDYLARYQHGILVQARLRAPKPLKTATVLTLKDRRHAR